MKLTPALATIARETTCRGATAKAAALSGQDPFASPMHMVIKDVSDWGRALYKGVMQEVSRAFMEPSSGITDSL